MGKKWKLLVPIIFSILLISTDVCNCAFYVEEGDTVDYTIALANLDANLGVHSFPMSGISIEGNVVDDGNTLTAEVDTVSSAGVLFIYSAREYDVYGFAPIQAYEFMITESTHYIFTIFEMGANSWSNLEGAFEHGFDILFLPTFVPFIDISDDTWDYIEGYAATYSHFFATATFDHANFTMTYRSNTKGDVFTGEWFVEMSDIRSTPSFNVSVTGTSQYQLSIQKSTGIILGSRYKGSCSGALNDDSVDFSAEILFKEVNYDMPAFKIGNAGISNVSLITGSIAIFIAVVFIKKRKIRK